MATWPPTLPSLSGTTAIVTGANTGIGLVAAQELARAGARVHLACRNATKAHAAMAAIQEAVPDANLAFLSLDLGSLEAVRAAAETFLATEEPLHLLVNNAGLLGSGTTADGFESNLGVNHIGVFLFTTLLLPRLTDSAPSRIVNVASRAHTRTKGIDFDGARKPTPGGTGFEQYCQSKLANVLFTSELAARIEGTGVTTACLHPGVVASDIWRKVPGPLRWIVKLFMITVEEGALTTLHCATTNDLVHGGYYDKCKPVATSRQGADRELAKRLWAATEEWVATPAPS